MRTNPFTLMWKSVVAFVEDDCATMAASLSYYTTFSLPPLLFFTVVIAGAVFGREAVQTHVLAQAHELVGPAAATQIQTMLRQSNSRLSDDGVSLLFSLGVLLFAATGVLVQLQAALNRVWEVRPDPDAGGIRLFLAKRLVSLTVLPAVAFLLLVSLVLSAAISAFGAVILEVLPRETSEGMLYIAELTTGLGLFTLVFAGMFRFLPDAKVAWRDVWVGALATAVLVTAGKFALGYYIGTGDAGAGFGAAGSLVVIMLWVYYTSMILLLGAEFTRLWSHAENGPIEPEPGAIRYQTTEVTTERG